MASKELLYIQQALGASIVEREERKRIEEIERAERESNKEKRLAQKEIRCAENKKTFEDSKLLDLLDELVVNKLLHTEKGVDKQAEIKWDNDNSVVCFYFNRWHAKKSDYLNRGDADGVISESWSQIFFQLTENNEVALQYEDRKSQELNKIVSIIGLDNIVEALKDVVIKDKAGERESVYVSGHLTF